MTEPDHFEAKVRDLGADIFRIMGREQPSAFNRRGISGKLMEWSMGKPELKVNMFRLVDVLPTLKSAKSVARHVSEYLEKPIADLSPALAVGLKGKPGILRSALTSSIVKFSVHEMARQFIAGESPAKALKALRQLRDEGMCFTVDLLGEYCVSEKEAAAYLHRYLEALEVFGREVPKWGSSKPLMPGHPGEISPVCISVKLSALYSQCGPLNFEKSVAILGERLAAIAREALKLNALLYVDAEDSATNPIIYTVFKNVFSKDEFAAFPYPGIVVQAYAKNSEAVLMDLLKFSKERGAPIAVRLVKGAYWDFETILSAQNNWPSPLFADKESTDANFEKLSRVLIDNIDLCLPAFGSHNIRSLSHACCYAEESRVDKKRYELQMLYGMAQPIASAFSSKGYLVRLYVPLGEILPGMGYLVRRLLENTSNESFLRHTFFEESQIETLLQRPISNGLIDSDSA
ncbi:MAG: proline dehydrogenase family protein [Deltaproteobacteria bacterium]|nr:proline dehydrogenase family protein [Deltaproteobacteria bacterium]